MPRAGLAHVSHLERILYPTVGLSWICYTNIRSNAHIQDVLVVSYLANTIRTQIDLSNRLATAALTLGTGDALADNGNQRDGDNNNRQRGGRGGGRGGGAGRGRQQREQEA
jgi:translation initiation factor 3 subunit F